MTMVPVALRRRQPDPAAPVLVQRSLPVPDPGENLGRAAVSVSTAVTSEPSLAAVVEKSSTIPPRWAVGLVALVLILVSALIGLGHPASYVLEALAGAGWLGVELVRALVREL